MLTTFTVAILAAVFAGFATVLGYLFQISGTLAQIAMDVAKIQ